MSEEEFDINFEYEHAAKVPAGSNNLPVVWSLKGPINGGYDDNKGGLVIPFLWEMGGKFITGFEVYGQWVQFIDHSADNSEHGQIVSARLAGLYSEVLRGGRA